MPATEEIARMISANGHNNKERVKQPSLTKLFGSNVFNDRVMKERLPKDAYKALKETIDILIKYCGGKVELAGIVSAK